MPVLVRIDQTISARNAQKFEDWWAGFGPVLRASKGFQLGVLGTSPGDPSSYTSATTWSDPESFRGFYRGEARQKQVEVGRELFTPRRTAQVYELVDRVGNPPRAADFGFAVMVEWTMPAGGATGREFAESRREIGELRQKHVNGFIAQSLWRHLGSPTRLLIAQAYRTRPEPAREVLAYMRAHPASDYTTVPQVVENFELVHRVDP